MRLYYPHITCAFTACVRAAQNRMVSGKLNPRTVAYFVTQVFPRSSLLFGKNTTENQRKWAAELRWAATVMSTRAFAPRYDGDGTTLIPLVDAMNHHSNGSLAHHTMSKQNPKAGIMSYGHDATMRYTAVRTVSC